MAGILKTALVTGAGKRIGKEIALDLARHGWAVAVHYNRSADAADEVVQAIRAGGGRAAAFKADMQREDEVSALVPAVQQGLGPVTLLVNNASPFVRDSIRDAEREVWDLHMETIVRAPVVLSRDFAQLLPDGQAGNIINMLDQRVWNLTPDFLSYTVAKSALWTLTRTLALALAPTVRVNGIGPGPTLPNERQTDAQFRAQWENVPLRHRTECAEICAAIQFILAAPALTGQMLALDGGEHLGWAQPGIGVTPTE